MRLYVIIQQLSDADISWGSAPTAFWLYVPASTFWGRFLSR